MSTRRRPATSATPATPPYSSIPLRWPRGDGRFYHCCTMTIPLPDGCDERRLFVYWEPGSLAHDVIERSLKRICKLYSDPSLAPPWGTVLDLNAAVAADLIAGVVKGSAVVVVDR